ncbi:hypothetical protein GCM10027586_04340 [Kineococcus gypseus]|uniref:helix-turn-helix domain-containing protein n=1 Tax=Kineococcus gypseus TaxID=1637102 RepID=UPI003D7D167E
MVQAETSGRQAWAHRVIAMMRQQGLTRAEVAERLEDPVSERTLRNILDGVVAPTPQRVAQIARVVGVQPMLLFRELEWVTAAEAAAVDSRSAAAGAIELLNHRRVHLPRGALLLVDRAQDLGYDTFTTTVPTSAGVPWRDYVGLRPPEHYGQSKDGMPDEELARRIRADFAVELRLAPALLEDSDHFRRPVHRLWPHAQAWFWVPRLMRTREARVRQPLAHAVSTLVVVGEHGSGMDDIGAYLAQRAGWGYVNTSFEAQRAFARDPRDPLAHAQRCLDVCEAYLRSELGQFRVISHGNPGTSVQVIDLLRRIESERRDRQGHGSVGRVALVYAKSNDALIEYGTRIWGTRLDPVVPESTADYRPVNEAAVKELVHEMSTTDGADTTTGPIVADDPAARVQTVDICLDASQLSARRSSQREVDLDPLYRQATESVWPALDPGAGAIAPVPPTPQDA